MDLATILNSATPPTSQARPLPVSTASYAKTSNGAPHGTVASGRATMPAKYIKTASAYGPPWSGDPTCGYRSHGHSVKPSSSLHSRSSTVHVDSSALQSLSLDSDRIGASRSRAASMQNNDQKTRYHRSLYGTSSSHGHVREATSARGAPAAVTAYSLHKAPTVWPAYQSSSQTHWVGRRINTGVPMSRNASVASAITDNSIADNEDHLSVTSQEDCGSISEDESRFSPITPDSDHTSHQIMPASGRCAFQEGCKLPTPNRKVTSQYFGRNKKETRGIPSHCWVVYCRQHYQRCKYRSSPDIWAVRTIGLVKKTVESLQAWGGVKDWTVALRKRVMDRLDFEDKVNREIAESKKRGVKGPDPIPKDNLCIERWLIRFCGNNCSFEDVYELLDAIIRYTNATHCGPLEFEIVPHFVDQHPKQQQQPAKRSAGKKHDASNRVTKSQRATAKQTSPRQIKDRVKS